MDKKFQDDYQDDILIDVKRHGKAIIIKILIPEVEMQNTPDIKEAILDLITDEPTHVILDLSLAKYFDSSGIAMVFKINQTLSEYSGILRLVGLNKSLLRVLYNVASYDDSTYYESVEKALEDVES